MKADHHRVEKQGLHPHLVLCGVCTIFQHLHLQPVQKQWGRRVPQLRTWKLPETMGTQTFSITSCADLSTSSSSSVKER